MVWLKIKTTRWSITIYIKVVDINYNMETTHGDQKTKYKPPLSFKVDFFCTASRCPNEKRGHRVRGKHKCQGCKYRKTYSQLPIKLKRMVDKFQSRHKDIPSFKYRYIFSIYKMTPYIKRVVLTFKSGSKGFDLLHKLRFKGVDVEKMIEDLLIKYYSRHHRLQRGGSYYG